LVPPAVSDSHALVSAYPRFGPPRDDHDPENLGPLIEDLALRCDTNGVRSSSRWRGSRWPDLVTGLRAYVDARRLAAPYDLEAKDAPPPRWLADQSARGAAVIAALGVWEQRAGSLWLRIGGHYAAVAGVTAPDAGPATLVLSDPLADSAAFGGGGQAVPGDPDAHGCREAPRKHDDAAAVSHDSYDLERDARLPDAPFVLAGYFTPDTYRDAAAFAGQNQLGGDSSADGWAGGPVLMALDAAVAVFPARPDRPTALPSIEPGGTAQATAAASATADGPMPSRTPIPSATADRTGSAQALLPLALVRRPDLHRRGASWHTRPRP